MWGLSKKTVVDSRQQTAAQLYQLINPQSFESGCHAVRALANAGSLLFVDICLSGLINQAFNGQQFTGITRLLR